MITTIVAVMMLIPIVPPSWVNALTSATLVGVRSEMARSNAGWSSRARPAASRTSSYTSELSQVSSTTRAPPIAEATRNGRLARATSRGLFSAAADSGGSTSSGILQSLSRS